MVNYYKYLSISAKDEAWGLTVLNAGCTRILPQSAYPFQSHPVHHNFNWAKGRVLQEYQLIYITRGKGLFESESRGTQEVGPGTILTIFPDERHRYKPAPETGWDEYWVGFKGNVADHLRDKGFLKPDQPSVPVGYHEPLINLFLEIIEETKEEAAGYQPLISGAVTHLLGHLQAAVQRRSFEGRGVEAVVKRAKVLFRTHIDQPITPQQVARELCVGYSKFRREFKAYTGLAPGQFQIQLKIQRAKELLVQSAKSVKEIAYALHFESSFYFSKLFKEKTGFSPAEYRKKVS